MKVLLQSVPRYDRTELPQVTKHLPCNPSIAFHGGRLLCAYRGCNYDLREGHFQFFYGSGPSRLPDSQSYIAEIGSDLACKSVDFIEDRHLRATPEFADGVEDVRLVPFRGRLLALASGVNFQPVLKQKRLIGDSKMILAELKDRKLHLIRSFDSRNPVEKNWMPVLGREQLDLVYSVSPFLLIEDVTGAGRQFGLRRIDQPEGLLPARGGSSLVPFRGGYMCIVHHMERRNALKYYSHQILLFDAQLKLTRASEIFKIEGERIEFGSGLLVEGTTIYLAYGLMDYRAVLLRLSEEDLFSAVF